MELEIRGGKRKRQKEGKQSNSCFLSFGLADALYSQKYVDT